mmetsp:Transcript_114043/g.159966  ORF Transcript_114043/g.159966 Transcript_114043/m.159966 type:complete len:81 (-) Transcript_114043:938-1180(-)
MPAQVPAKRVSVFFSGVSDMLPEEARTPPRRKVACLGLLGRCLRLHEEVRIAQCENVSEIVNIVSISPMTQSSHEKSFSS